MALTWSGKRQLIVSSIGGAVILFFLYSIISPSFKTPASCFDGKQNGSELGLDCGGSCALLCPFQGKNIIIRWARSFPVTYNIYNAVAYVENQNVNSAVKSISYEFKFYDKDNVFITSRTGQTFIGPIGKFLIFEPSIDVGNRPVAKTLFAFTASPQWITIDKRASTFPLFVRDVKLSDSSTSPKIEAQIANDSIYKVSDLNVVALIYDKDGNVITTSKTYLESVDKNSSQTVFFTWPQSFGVDVSRIEVFPDLNPFKINF